MAAKFFCVRKFYQAKGSDAGDLDMVQVSAARVKCLLTCVVQCLERLEDIEWCLETKQRRWKRRNFTTSVARKGGSELRSK